MSASWPTDGIRSQLELNQSNPILFRTSTNGANPSGSGTRKSETRITNEKLAMHLSETSVDSCYLLCDLVYLLHV